jgi:hypothetical protein
VGFAVPVSFIFFYYVSIRMGSKYKFNAEGRKTDKLKSLWPKSERLGIAAVIIIAAILVVSIGGYYATGYVTYNENQKKVCENNLSVCATNLVTCNNDVVGIQNQLTTCHNDVTQANEKSTDLQTMLNNCTDEKGILSTQTAEAITGYKILAKSSVKPICCSYSDAQSGSVKNWGIMSNFIVCDGNYTINCTTGETNY